MTARLYKLADRADFEPEPWRLHEWPDRRLDECARICSCVGCREAIACQAAQRPRDVVCVKTEQDRILVTLELLAEAQANDDLAGLLYAPDDRIRELFVPLRARPLRRGQRWWSTSCHEDEDLLGRPHPRHRKPKRQSRVARRARQEQWAAEQAMLPPVASRPAPWPAPPPLADPREALADQRVVYAEVLAALRRWAFEAGRSVDLDRATYVLTALALQPVGPDEAYRHRTPADPLAREDIARLVECDLWNVSAFHRCRVPDLLSETTWQLLDFLAATDRLHHDSDPVDVLKDPLRCYCGLDESGQARPEGSKRVVDCRCHVTYRGPTHGEVAAAARAPGNGVG